jgi:hypothetical protein
MRQVHHNDGTVRSTQRLLRALGPMRGRDFVSNDDCVLTIALTLDRTPGNLAARAHACESAVA